MSVGLSLNEDIAIVDNGLDDDLSQEVHAAETIEHTIEQGMGLEDACVALSVTPRQLGQMVQQGLVTRHFSGKQTRFVVEQDGVEAKAARQLPESSNSDYVNALVARLFDMEEQQSYLSRKCTAVEDENAQLREECKRLIRERNIALARYTSAHKELNRRMDDAQKVIAQTRRCVSAAIDQVNEVTRAS